MKTLLAVDFRFRVLRRTVKTVRDDVVEELGDRLPTDTGRTLQSRFGGR